jgi:hypothetical protein
MIKKLKFNPMLSEKMDFMKKAFKNGQQVQCLSAEMEYWGDVYDFGGENHNWDRATHDYRLIVGGDIIVSVISNFEEIEL